LENISNTSSLKEKENLLREQKDNDQLFSLLSLHSNPYIQFYVAKLPTERPNIQSKNLGSINNYDHFIKLTNALSGRIITGHEALATVHDFFQHCDEDEKWVYKTVLLKESLNFGASLINKVRKGCIPEFKLMLADAVQPKMSDVRFPIIAQTKLDGFRAVYVPMTQSFIGRNGKPIRNENLKNHFTKMIEKNVAFVLDGELYSDKLSFNEIASRLNSENKDLTDIYYCLYDVLTILDWSKQVSNQPYKERIKTLEKELIPLWDDKNIKVVQGKVVNSVEELQEFYKEKLDEEYEGLMLKDMNGKYQWKRVSCKSGIMAKLKPRTSYDGKIVDALEGEGQAKGMLGAFVVEVEHIKNQVKIGTGFSEVQKKEYWLNRNKLIGEWVVLDAFEITENNESLRFPVFMGIRDSKD